MEDSELTRKAIEELMKEMDEHKEKQSLQTERKKNPLGRPNKHFLGRTINSIMKHNKRHADRNLQRCQRKLKELDAKKTKHEPKKHRKDHCAKFEYYQETISSDSSHVEFVRKARKKKKRNKKRKKYKSRSPSPNSTSSSSASSNSSNSSAKSKIKSRKKKRHKMIIKDEEIDQDFYSNHTSEPTMGYYVDPNMAYAVMAYNQMNHIMQQQQLQQQVMLEKELEESVEVPSDLSLSFHSSPESSLNISLHSSSAEEDENGVITFQLSSDDEENVPNISRKANKNSTKESIENISLKDNCDDNESVRSHISLESKDSQSIALKETKEIYVLSSSDSDELEIVETIPATSSK